MRRVPREQKNRLMGQQRMGNFPLTHFVIEDHPCHWVHHMATPYQVDLILIRKSRESAEASRTVEVMATAPPHRSIVDKCVVPWSTGTSCSRP